MDQPSPYFPQFVAFLPPVRFPIFPPAVQQFCANFGRIDHAINVHSDMPFRPIDIAQGAVKGN